MQKSPLCSITASSRASTQFLANSILRVLTAGLPRTEILKSLLVWTVPAFAPMSLLWFGRLLEEGVRDRLQIGVAKATREYTIQNPDSNPSEGTDAGDQVVLQFAH